jgi:hypothetical protein
MSIKHPSILENMSLKKVDMIKLIKTSVPTKHFEKVCHNG